jgi:two-component system sensor histidine kinase UhpB
MNLMQPSWRHPKSLVERLTRGQFRGLVVLVSLAVFAWDFLTELPVPLFYMVAIGFTFWSTDRWMPMAAALTSSTLIIVGLASPLGDMSLRQGFLLRTGGALIFVGSAWLITRHRALLSAAAEREAVLRTIFDSEPACVKVLGPGCILLDMNRAGLDMIEADSLDSVRGHCVLPLIVEEYRDAFARLADRVFASEAAGLQFEVVGLKGTRRWMDMRAAPLFDGASQVTSLLAVTYDVTERIRVEEKTRRNEQRLALATEMAGLGFYEHDYRTGAIYWSERARAILGMSASETWSAKELHDATHPDDRGLLLSELARVADPRNGTMALDYRVLLPGGAVRDVRATARMFFDDLEGEKRPRAAVATIVDVTERKQAEGQRDALALRVLEAQENERRAVARDLHDEIGQALSALKLNLLRLRREGGGAGPIVADSLRIADEVLQHVRDIALSLRPSILDDLGLGAAVQWYAEQAGARANLTVTCEVDAKDAGLSPATEIACFRVLQEALTNVVRHAAARSVLVQLRDNGSNLELVVRDDGRGFDDQVNRHGGRVSSMGLLGIRERAALLGGVTTVTSAPGVGCEVLVRLPRVPHDGTLVEAIA